MKNQKTPPHSVGPDSAHRTGTAGLADPTDGTMRGVLRNKVLPTTSRTLPKDDPTKWGGQALTEATWH
jgi:hypothetical protein